MTTAVRTIRAPRGTTLSCKGWAQEAALRMLMNNLDPEVAERPEQLIVYGGTGRAARSWEAYEAIVRSLRALDDDETLLVQSGKPVGVFRTHADAPRVLIANANLVPAWATWETFRDLEDRGLTMYGQMTAGSWIYIGTQGILQGTYETLAALAARHFGGSLAGRLTVSAGLGGMGGAQPLAITMNQGVALVVEVDPTRIARRLATRYVDEATDSLDVALARCAEWTAAGTARSIALCANAADVLPALVARGVVPDVVTDQTSAHDAVGGYVPDGLTLAEAAALRARDPRAYEARSVAAMGRHVAAMLALKRRGAVVFDYGNNIRAQAVRAGVTTRSRFRDSCPSSCGRSSARARVPSAGRCCRAIRPTSPPPTRGARDVRRRRRAVPLDPAGAGPGRVPGTAGADLLARLRRAGAFGLRLNQLVREGHVSAPIVIGRDHLDTGSVASPNRETEGMRDGSDAIADWPLLNALLNTSAGATWVSVHHGGGVGIGYSLHAGMVIVADGTREADRPARARADVRPGHRRGPPRRCRLSRGHRDGRDVAACGCRCRSSVTAS